jgi:hypothetical protein
MTTQERELRGRCQDLAGAYPLDLRRSGGKQQCTAHRYLTRTYTYMESIHVES